MKSSRLEDKVSHLSQIIEKIEERNKELLVEVNTLQQQRENDGKKHLMALAEQEKKM